MLTTTSLVSADNHPLLIDQPRAVAPSLVSANATVIHQGKEIAKGSNGWAGMAETLPGDNSAICNDARGMTMRPAVATKASFEARPLGFV
ncbi:hypothetical protein [Aestuariirhabdus litorea]|uniref:Uncharacterized protein n=1 Tax=Aestuariirhabdus litorea TaxID=2528527 RepID=A0A3P3VIT1_9GAMM|nr:hypothetical protein [Aestuariirhabdus litorea]RRJ82264.1 hypothetical protein D0544_10270 [Aestuariirhabdus litorea]RWW92431.1 hypothetical protein DZC74_10255 [Endozoicomonadaceae bacterium GTF-13]